MRKKGEREREVERQKREGMRKRNKNLLIKSEIEGIWDIESGPKLFLLS